MIDETAEARLYGRSLSAARRTQMAGVIVARLGAPRAYAGAFGELPREQAVTASTFTGENLGRSAGRRHVLAEEACRTLRCLRVRASHAALREADDRLAAQIARVQQTHHGCPHGTYCCPLCTLGVWRHVAAGGLASFAPQLPAGLRHLRADRDDAGGWRHYPFFYTLSALLELNLPAARVELRYAAARCGRLLEKQRAAEPYGERRREILRRVITAGARR